MPAQVELSGKNGIHPKIRRQILELFSGLLAKAKLNGVFSIRLGNQVKGAPHRQGIAHINVRHHDTSGVHLRIQPGDNKTSFEVIIVPPVEMRPEKLRESLARTVRDIKIGHGGQRKPIAKMEVAFQKMVTLCRIFEGNPFTASRLSDREARLLGYVDKRSLCSGIRAFSKKDTHLNRSSGIYSFSDEVKAEAFPERAEPTASPPDENPAETGEEAVGAVEPLAVVEKDAAIVSAGDQPPDAGIIESTTSFLHVGMTPLLHTALGLLAEGSATQRVTVPNQNGSHQEDRLSSSQLGLTEEENDLVFPILEIAKILHREEESGRDGKPVLSVNLPLARGVMALLSAKEGVPAAPKKGTSEEVERQIEAIVARRSTISADSEKIAQSLPSLLERVSESSARIAILRNQLVVEQRALAEVTGQVRDSEAIVNSACLQDDLLAHEEERLRQAYKTLTEVALQEAVSSLKTTFTPAQLAKLREMLI